MAEQVVIPARPFRYSLFGVGVTGSNVDLATDPMAASEVMYVGGVTVVDIDNNADRVVLLVGRYGAEQEIANSGSLSNEVPYRFLDNFYLADGERLVIRFVGTTDADRLIATLEGTQKYQVPPVVPVAG